MDNYMFSGFGLGRVANDIEEDDQYVDIYPIEIHPNKDGDVTSADKITETVSDIDGVFETTQVVGSTLIRAKWLCSGESNRLEPPTVCKGETVRLYRFGNMDAYFWEPMFNELHLRKLEKRSIILSNKRSLLKGARGLFSKTYYVVMDTINKFIRLHTDDSDGEYTTWDIEIDTKAGKLTIIDGKGNEISIDSLVDMLYLHTNKDILLKTKNLTTEVAINKSETIGSHYGVDLKTYHVYNGRDELIQVLVDLAQACSDDIGIGNLRLPVARSEATKQAYADIKSRLEGFQE